MVVEYLDRKLSEGVICLIQAFRKSHIPPFLIITGLFLAFISYSWPFVMDDAYISFTYSKNLAQGNGLTYNGMLVEGFSNPLWTLLIVPFIWFGVDPLLGARFLAILAMLMTLYLTWQMTHRLFPGVTSLIASLVTLAVATNITVLSWTVSGMETPLITFLVLLLVYLETHPTPGGWLPSALIVIGLALTRPEGIMLFPIVLAYRLIRGDYSLKANVKWTLLIIALIALFILCRIVVYGHPLPNTAYIKIDRDSTTFMLGWNYISSFFLIRPTFSILLVVGTLLLLKDGLKISSDWLLIAAIISGFTTFAWYVGGDWMPYHRFLMPIVPLLALVLARGLAVAIGNRWFRLLPRILAASAILMEVVFLIVFCSDVFTLTASHQQSFISTGKWIQANTDSTAVIAIVDAGMLAYYSERKVIDIIGLNNAHIAHSDDKSDPQYVLDQQPYLVQLHARRDADGVWYDPDSKAGNNLIQYEPFYRLYQPAEPFIDFPIGDNWFIRRDVD